MCITISKFSWIPKVDTKSIHYGVLRIGLKCFEEVQEFVYHSEKPFHVYVALIGLGFWRGLKFMYFESVESVLWYEKVYE